MLRRLKAAMTVGRLKEILSELPDDMFVGRVGHFGEFVDMSERGACVKVTYLDEPGSHDRVELTVLELEAPDIGPEPD
jgi:hypothetical protein